MVDEAGGGAAEEPRWLSEDEQAAWRAVLHLALLLPGPLDAQLQRTSGIGLFEYLVLSSLSMAPERTSRMSDLARLANGSLSRLSNAVKRMEARGLVRRRPDPEDGRCTDATLTDAGWDVVVAAAPGHVAAVRHHLVDPLTSEQLRTLVEVGARVQRQLEGPA